MGAKGGPPSSLFFTVIDNVTASLIGVCRERSGSGTALARLFVALVETHQQADGSVSIPAALQPYLKADRIKP